MTTHLSWGMILSASLGTRWSAWCPMEAKFQHGENCQKRPEGSWLTVQQHATIFHMPRISELVCTAFSCATSCFECSSRTDADRTRNVCFVFISPHRSANDLVALAKRLSGPSSRRLHHYELQHAKLVAFSGKPHSCNETGPQPNLGSLFKLEYEASSQPSTLHMDAIYACQRPAWAFIEPLRVV